MAGISIAVLLACLMARPVTSALSGAGSGLDDTLRIDDLPVRIGADHRHDDLAEAVDALGRDDPTSL